MNNWQKLKWLILSGITESIGEDPVNRLKKKEISKIDLPLGEKKALSAVQDNLVDQAVRLAAQATTLVDLYTLRASLDGCSLKKTAAHTVHGRGNTSPRLLCLIDVPDASDDKGGVLMSGPAGNLLDKMLGAIGLDLTNTAYVTSLCPWRAPGNRKLTDVEKAVCRPFWEKEIQMLKPTCILAFGGGVSEALLGSASLSRMRGHWHDYQGIPVRVSISPATLIKLPEQKKQAWEDLQAVAGRLTSGESVS